MTHLLTLREAAEIAMFRDTYIMLAAIVCLLVAYAAWSYADCSKKGGILVRGFGLVCVLKTEGRAL